MRSRASEVEHGGEGKSIDYVLGRLSQALPEGVALGSATYIGIFFALVFYGFSPDDVPVSKELLLACLCLMGIAASQVRTLSKRTFQRRVLFLQKLLSGSFINEPQYQHAMATVFGWHMSTRFGSKAHDSTSDADQVVTPGESESGSALLGNEEQTPAWPTDNAEAQELLRAHDAHFDTWEREGGADRNDHRERLADLGYLSIGDGEGGADRNDMHRTGLTPKNAPVIDEHVRFTVYRPVKSRPAVWNTMLAFAYRASDADEGGGDIAESGKQVEQLATHTLGPQIQGFAALTTESREAVPRDGMLRFVPRFDDVEFNPAERSFRWVERIHQESFRYRVSTALDGQTAHGRMEVYLDVVLIGEVGLAVAVDSGLTTDDGSRLVATHGSRYRKIFASYSHKDLPIVEQFKAYANALGDDFIRDWTHLRSGEVWSEELRELITQADVFQLFWSQNSMQSAFVREEWEYALTLKHRVSSDRCTGRNRCRRTDQGLPPETLKALHFHRFKLPSQGGVPAVDADAKDETRRTGMPTGPRWRPSVGRGEALKDPECPKPICTSYPASRGRARPNPRLLLIIAMICAIFGAILSLVWRSR